jgi:hypothetical protein
MATAQFNLEMTFDQAKTLWDLMDLHQPQDLSSGNYQALKEIMSGLDKALDQVHGVSIPWHEVGMDAEDE